MNACICTVRATIVAFAYNGFSFYTILVSKGFLKKCGPVQNGQGEKSCEIKGGGQEMAELV